MGNIKINVKLQDFDGVDIPISNTIIKGFGDVNPFIDVMNNIKKEQSKVIGHYDSKLLIFQNFVNGLLLDDIDQISEVANRKDYKHTITKQFITLDETSFENINLENVIITITKSQEQDNG